MEVTEVKDTPGDGVDVQVDGHVWYTISEAPDGKPMVEPHDLSVGGNDTLQVALDWYREHYE